MKDVDQTNTYVKEMCVTLEQIMSKKHYLILMLPLFLSLMIKVRKQTAAEDFPSCLSRSSVLFVIGRFNFYIFFCLLFCSVVSILVKLNDLIYQFYTLLLNAIHLYSILR